MRRANETDIPFIVGLVVSLARSVEGPQRVCRVTTGETIAGLLASDQGAVWVSDGGFIAGLITRSIISPDPIAVELGWYAEDRSGIRLLRAFEAWAYEGGARLIKMSANGGQAAKILERAGYRACETAWVK